MNRILCRIALALAGALVAAGALAAMPKQPTLVVPTLDGKSFDLSAQRGKWVVVNFWGTWCSPCIKEMPDISKFVESRQDVRAIGIAFGGEEREDVVAFLAKHPVKYPVANVPLDKPPGQFDPPKGLPTTYLISPTGDVAKKFTGPVTSGDLEKAIAAGAKKS